MKAGRNHPCPCGSGRKSKKCCELNRMGGLDLDRLLDNAQRERLDGRLEQAEQLCREILAAEPHHAGALHLLGAVAGDTGRNELAVALIQEVVAVAPSHSDAHTNLGVALHALGRSEEALAHIHRALALTPQSTHALRNCAVVLSDLGRWTEAATYLRRRVALEPNNAGVYRMLGDWHARQGLRQEAVPYYLKALELDPSSVDAASNLGACLADGGHRAPALALLCKVVELNPGSAAAWANLGVATKNLGDVETALRCFNRTLEIEPGDNRALWNRSLCLLGTGKLTEGWSDYEWRWKASQQCRDRPFYQPRWDGSDPKGKTVLVWMEQGLGDQLLFASLLPDLLHAGAHCLVECEWRLEKLFARSFPGVEVVPSTEPPHPRTQQPGIDFQIPAGSLPRWFRPNVESFPSHSGYLVPDPVRAGHWRERLEGLGEGPKVGICWRSGMTKGMRSMHYSQLNQWGPILTTSGVHFVKLQYDECDEELRESQRLFGTPVHVWNGMDLKNDLEDVAALTSTLDLVISAGTAVDAMAGAIGIPAWVLIRGCTEWWGLGTDYCPWSPSARPFPCGANEPWEPVIEKIASELGQWAAAGPARADAAQ
jgi:tetratricopeptide (TPR) repeat protein